MSSLLIGNPTKSLLKHFNTLELTVGSPKHFETIKNINNDISRIYTILYDEKFDTKQNSRKNIVSRLSDVKDNIITKLTLNLAHYSHRKVQNDKTILLGESEEYEPLSRGAYFKKVNE